jgi:hypothetical protein
MAAAPERLTWINDLVHTSVRGFILSWVARAKQISISRHSF